MLHSSLVFNIFYQVIVIDEMNVVWVVKERHIIETFRSLGVGSLPSG